MGSNYVSETQWCGTAHGPRQDETMSRSMKIHVAGFILLFGAIVAAQVQPVNQSRSETLIRGTVLDKNSRPLPNAPLRLRNLATHQIEQMSTSTARGEFSFVVRPGATYVVELSDRVGRVLAVGSALTPVQGEAVSTVVSMGTALPVAKSLVGVFGDSAGLVVSAASSAGITALAPTPPPPPASPER